MKIEVKEAFSIHLYWNPSGKNTATSLTVLHSYIEDWFKENQIEYALEKSKFTIEFAKEEDFDLFLLAFPNLTIRYL